MHFLFIFLWLLRTFENITHNMLISISTNPQIHCPTPLQQKMACECLTTISGYDTTATCHSLSEGQSAHQSVCGSIKQNKYENKAMKALTFQPTCMASNCTASTKRSSASTQVGGATKVSNMATCRRALSW